MTLYDKYLQLNINNIECDNYECKFTNNLICNICGFVCKKQYTTNLHQIKTKIKTCYLCNIVVNFTKYDINKVILVKSTLTQKQINNLTLEHYYNYGDIIMPLDLDKNIKIIKINLFDYVLNNKNNFVIVFNSNVENYLKNNDINLFNGGSKIIVKNTYNTNVLKYYELPEFKYDNKTKLQHFSEINDISESIKKKINKVKENIDNKQKVLKLLNLLNLLNLN